MAKDYDDIKIPNNLDDYIKNGIDEATSDMRNNSIDKEMYIMKTKKSNLSKVAITTLILCSALALTNENTFANIKSFIENPSNISSILGTRNSLEDYATIVDTTVSDNGIDITLKEVVLDPVTNELYILSYIKSDLINNENSDIHNFHMSNAQIYINGKSVNSGGTSKQRYIGENIIECIQSYDIDNSIDLFGDIDLKIKFTSASYINFDEINYLSENVDENSNQEGISKEEILETSIVLMDSIYGNWTFEFCTNGEALGMDTKIVDLGNKKISFNNDENSIILKEYIANDLSQKIIFEFENYSKLTKNGMFGIVELDGVDNLGNNISWYNSGIKTSESDESIGTFELSIYGVNEDLVYESSINENAEYLTLNLYYRIMDMESGQLSTTHTKLDEELIIYLSGN